MGYSCTIDTFLENIRTHADDEQPALVREGSFYALQIICKKIEWKSHVGIRDLIFRFLTDDNESIRAKSSSLVSELASLVFQYYH
jgi:hypothetical protein